MSQHCTHGTLAFPLALLPSLSILADPFLSRFTMNENDWSSPSPDTRDPGPSHPAVLTDARRLSCRYGEDGRSPRIVLETFY